MKLPLPVLGLTLAVSVAAHQQAPLRGAQDGDLKLPGTNPLNYCASPSAYLVDIDYVDLDPNPPVPGQLLIIKAGGTVKKQLAAGSKVHVTVRLGPYVKLIDDVLDLCEKLGEVDLACPVEKGYLNITKEVAIPGEVPPAKFLVRADAYTEDEETITCLEGSVDFGGRN